MTQYEEPDHLKGRKIRACPKLNSAKSPSPLTPWLTKGPGYNFRYYQTEEGRGTAVCFYCMDCEKDHGITFMLRHEIWNLITSPEERRGLMCIDCASARLGEPVSRSHLWTQPPCNYSKPLAEYLGEDPEWALEEFKTRIQATLVKRGKDPEKWTEAIHWYEKG